MVTMEAEREGEGGVEQEGADVPRCFAARSERDLDFNSAFFVVRCMKWPTQAEPHLASCVLLRPRLPSPVGVFSETLFFWARNAPWSCASTGFDNACKRPSVQSCEYSWHHCLRRAQGGAPQRGRNVTFLSRCSQRCTAPLSPSSRGA